MQKFEVLQERKSVRLVKTIQISKAHAACRIESWIIGPDGEKLDEQSIERICGLDQLDKAFVSPTYIPEHVIARPPGSSSDLRLRYLPKSKVAEFATKSFSNHCSELGEYGYEQYLQLSTEELEPVYLDYGSHIVFGLDEEPLPVMIACNYMDGQIRSSMYDLVAMRKHLAKREDILDLSKIELIPHFNNETGSEMMMSFKVVPNLETYRMAWGLALEHGRKYPSTRMRELYIAGLDAIGINQFRLASSVAVEED